MLEEFDQFIRFCLEHGETLRNHKTFGDMARELRSKIELLESKDKNHLVENIAAWVTRWSLSKDRDIGELRAFLRDRLYGQRSRKGR